MSTGTGPWLKFHAAFFSDPKVVRAGPEAALVYIAFLTIAKLNGRGGRFSEEFADPEYLSSYLRAEVTDVTVTRCFDVGLVKRDGDMVCIPAWRKYQHDPGVTDRVRAHRERVKRDETVTERSNERNDDRTGQDTEDRTRQDKPSLKTGCLECFDGGTNVGVIKGNGAMKCCSCKRGFERVRRLKDASAADDAQAARATAARKERPVDFDPLGLER